VFDVGLLVKFVPFSEYIDSIGGMSSKSIAAPSYDAEVAEEKRKEQIELDELATKLIAGMLSTHAEVIQTTRPRTSSRNLRSHGRLKLVRRPLKRHEQRKYRENARREHDPIAA
jgi:hypothetical protein